MRKRIHLAKKKCTNLKLAIGPSKNRPNFDVTIWPYRVDVVPHIPHIPTCPGPDRCLTNLPACPIPVSTCVSIPVHKIRYRRRYRRNRINVVPNLASCAVPVLMSIRYSYRTVVIDVPILSKYPVPKLMLYRSYRSVRAGIDVVPISPKCPVPVLMYKKSYGSTR